MALIIDNDAIKFLEEIRPIYEKYVKSSSLLAIEFKDGSTIGMGVVLRYALGNITLQQAVTGNFEK